MTLALRYGKKHKDVSVLYSDITLPSFQLRRESDLLPVILAIMAHSRHPLTSWSTYCVPGIR